MTTSDPISIEHVAEHIPYLNQQTQVLEVALADCQDKLLWGIQLEREGMETQMDCMNRIEEITVVLNSRKKSIVEG